MPFLLSRLQEERHVSLAVAKMCILELEKLQRMKGIDKEEAFLEEIKSFSDEVMKWVDAKLENKAG